MKSDDDKPPGVLEKILVNINSELLISSYLKKSGVGFKIKNSPFYLAYPPKIWEKFPLLQRRILAENLTYAYTFYLPYLFPKIQKIKYLMPVPLSDSFLFKGFAYSLPSTALMQKTKEKKSTINLLRRLFYTDYEFQNKKPLIPQFRKTSNSKKVIIPFSFGKDSLLTLALSIELGLTPYPVYIAEPDYQYELTVKEKLAEDFFKEFKIKVEILNNTFGIFREHEGFFGWELQLTHYSLMLLPYVYAHNCGYLIFANEQSCNDQIIDSEGFICNPVFEQSKSWLLQNSVLSSLVGGNALTIGSMIEPLYEIAILKILHHRYPSFVKYQSSCDPEDKGREKLRGRRWCQNCSKCGRIFMFLLANGLDPRKVGLTKWLLAEKFKSLYSIFEDEKIKSYGYDQSQAGKEEQLFAFYLAYKRGVKGPLMDEFIKKYLKETQRKEKYYRQKFFGIHSDLTVPPVYKKRLLSIFHQELDPLVK